MASNMQILYHEFADNPDVQFISITVDPHRDTYAVLQDYAKMNGVDDDRWLFLRGDLEKVVDLSENGFYLSAENLPMGHSVKFTLVDKTAAIRGYFSGTHDQEIEELKMTIKQLLN
jgi:protein SCO1/2